MKPVGATNPFVRTPFLIEGLILGIFGAAAAYGLAALGYLKLFLPAAGRLAFVSAVPFDAVAVPLAAVYAAVGVLMGLLGSSIAINRYLKH